MTPLNSKEVLEKMTLGPRGFILEKKKKKQFCKPWSESADEMEWLSLVVGTKIMLPELATFSTLKAAASPYLGL